jgi:hypothetical protein
MRLLAIPAAVLVLVGSAAALPRASEPAAAVPTFTKDVAPILYNRCANCHRPEEMAPMSLLTYEEVRPWVKAIQRRVTSREMPPWFADPAHGQFSNDSRLPQAEIDTIAAWAAAGAPKGDAKDLPPVPKFEPGWTIGKPDVVLTMPESYSVAADGTIPYLYFTVPTNFTEDKWVQSVEIRPGNRKVVHHVIISIQDGERAKANPIPQGSARPGRVNVVTDQLAGTTPNRPGMTFPPGTARLVKAGSVFVFQMHYTTNGEATTDQTSVGIVFAKTPPQKSVQTGLAANNSFVIPPGEGNHEVKSSTTMAEDVKLLSFMPHMHFRGKDFKYTATYPDGRSEVLLNVPKYDFNWQLTYTLKEPVSLPKGTRLDCVAHFDNSTANKSNPDPKQEVRWGDQTWEEMMIGWYSYTRDAEQLGKSTAAPQQK